MPKTTVKRAIFLLLALAAALSACGPQRFTPDEVERNGYFSEIARRADRRELGEDEFLRTALRYPSSEGVPVWAALALANIGDPRSLPWLDEGMKSPCASVRAASAFAVGEIEDRDQLRREGRQPSPRTPQELLFATGDTAPAVRMRAIEALGKTGTHAEAVEILKQTEDFHYDGSPQQRAFLSLVITALMRLKDTRALPFLHRMASSNDPQIQWRAANALIRLHDTTACGIFRRLLKSADTDVRAYGARGLGLCGPSQREDEAALARLLPRRDPASGGNRALSVRVSALQALASLAGERSIPAFEDALREVSPPDPEQVNFAVQAAQALGNIGSPQAEGPLRYLLTQPSPVRDAAVIALARTLKDEPERFFNLARAADFAQARGERAWAAALGELTGPRAAKELRAMLDHRAGDRAVEAPDTVIPVILQSLAKAGAADLDRLLQLFLDWADGVALRTALELYDVKAGAPDPWTPFAQSYRAMPASARLDAAETAIGRLEPWAGRPPVQSLLREALRDPQRNVRVAAMRLLRLSAAESLPITVGAAATRATASVYELAAASRQNRTLAMIETDRGVIEIELFRQDAPLTVDNFVFLARQGFYDGLTFMRVVPYFVIQGGDPRNDQEGGPGYTIRCEINMRPFGRGSVGMALSGKDTGGSQFFITLSPQPHLDGGYTCFGQVISGMEAAERVVPGDVIRHIRIVEDVTLLDGRRF